VHFNEKIEQALLKEQQKQRRKILAENRLAEEQKRRKDRYKYVIGEVFINKFPIIYEMMEQSSKEELSMHIDVIEKYMDAIAECLKCWKELEDILVKQR